MIKIKTGRGSITLITLISIWSISALTSLPGLAISPILGKLSTIFPESTELDVQMLTSLPSLLIIPFIIISGKLTQKVNTKYLLQTGLLIFGFCAVAYMFATKMWQLILISAILGIGAGLVIPLSTGLISQYFKDEYRVKQFGLSSAIANLTLVLATSLTGYLVNLNWHLPFVVYLLSFVSICLSFKLKNEPIDPTEGQQSTEVSNSKYSIKTRKSGINSRNIVELTLFYGLLTFITVLISFNIPFLMKEYGLNSENSGLIISLYFLAMMVSGILFKTAIKTFKNRTILYSLIAIALGLGMIVMVRSEIVIALGCILAGLGYGIIQPSMYEKASLSAIPSKNTLALSYVMAANYVAILLCPFITNAFTKIFDNQSQQLPFIINTLLAIIIIVVAYLKRDLFVFREQST